MQRGNLDAVLLGEVSDQVVNRGIQQPIWVKPLNLTAHVALLGVRDGIDVGLEEEKVVLAALEIHSSAPVVQLHW